MYYGYHRTSTDLQNLDRGIKEIEDFCIKNSYKLEKVFVDKQTGKNFNRPRYIVLKEDVLRDGDVLIITELDRLGRNKEETLKELKHFNDSGVRVMILEIPTTLVDYTNMDNSMATMIMQTINNVLIEMYAVIAHTEMLKREKRQREGIQAKKDRNDWDNYGRPKAIDYNVFANEYKKVITGELKPFECMKKLNMKKSTFYHYSKKYKQINSLIYKDKN